MNLFAEASRDRIGLLLGWEVSRHVAAVGTTHSLLSSVHRCLVGFGYVLGSRNPSIPLKFTYGLVQLGVGFTRVGLGRRRSFRRGVG